MARSVVGLFETKESADEAITKLANAGFSPDGISVISKESEGEGNSQTENITEGAAKGATLGGVAGLIVGVASVVVPGLAPLVIVGPVATALGLTGAAAAGASTAVVGTLAGGLVGAFVGLGIPKEEAEMYESRIKEGYYMLTVEVDGGNESEVKEIFNDSGATQVNSYNLK